MGIAFLGIFCGVAGMRYRTPLKESYVLRQQLRDAPDDADLHERYAFALGELPDFLTRKFVIKHFERAVELDSIKTLSLGKLSLLLERDDPERSLMLFSRLARTTKDWRDQSILLRRAFVARKELSKNPKAWSRRKGLIDLDEEIERLQKPVFEGLVARSRKSDETAEEAAHRVLRLAAIFEDWDAGISLSQEYAAKWPQGYPWKLELASFHERKGDHRTALKIYETLVEEKPGSDSGFYGSKIQVLKELLANPQSFSMKIDNETITYIPQAEGVPELIIGRRTATLLFLAICGFVLLCRLKMKRR